MSRLLRLTTRVQGLFVAASIVLLVGLVLSLFDHSLGSRVSGVGMVALAGLLHSLFLGFVLSMIFGHAPIIFPAVLGLPI